MQEDDTRAVPGWIGCPHCEQPINARALLEDRTADLASTVLGLMEERGIHDPTLKTRLESVLHTAREMAAANLPTHPFKTLAPET